MATDQQKLDALKDALQKLAEGKQVVEAWDGDFRVRYTPANADEMRRQIADLQAAIDAANGLCPNVRRPLRLIL